MVKITIDYNKINSLKESVLKRIMLNRAYEGYLKYLVSESENSGLIIEGVSYNEFKDFEYWKVHLAFRQYFAWCRGDNFKSSHIDFKSLILNRV